MYSFTEFATKSDWCLNNGITDSDQGNDYVSGLEDKIMNGVYPKDCKFFSQKCTHPPWYFGTTNLKFM